MNPAQKELWDYCVQLVACEKKSRQQALRQKRQVCVGILCDSARDDEDALMAVRQLVR